jgi:hypothetical protein
VDAASAKGGGMGYVDYEPPEEEEEEDF